MEEKIQNNIKELKNNILNYSFSIEKYFLDTYNFLISQNPPKLVPLKTLTYKNVSNCYQIRNFTKKHYENLNQNTKDIGFLFSDDFYNKLSKNYDIISEYNMVQINVPSLDEQRYDIVYDINNILYSEIDFLEPINIIRATNKEISILVKINNINTEEISYMIFYNQIVPFSRKKKHNANNNNNNNNNKTNTNNNNKNHYNNDHLEIKLSPKNDIFDFIVIITKINNANPSQRIVIIPLNIKFDRDYILKKYLILINKLEKVQQFQNSMNYVPKPIKKKIFKYLGLAKDEFLTFLKFNVDISEDETELTIKQDTKYSSERAIMKLRNLHYSSNEKTKSSKKTRINSHDLVKRALFSNQKVSYPFNFSTNVPFDLITLDLTTKQISQKYDTRENSKQEYYILKGFVSKDGKPLLSSPLDEQPFLPKETQPLELTTSSSSLPPLPPSSSQKVIPKQQSHIKLDEKEHLEQNESALAMKKEWEKKHKKTLTQPYIDMELERIRKESLNIYSLMYGSEEKIPLEITLALENNQIIEKPFLKYPPLKQQPQPPLKQQPQPSVKQQPQPSVKQQPQSSVKQSQPPLKQQSQPPLKQSQPSVKQQPQPPPIKKKIPKNTKQISKTQSLTKKEQQPTLKKQKKQSEQQQSEQQQSEQQQSEQQSFQQQQSEQQSEQQQSEQQQLLQQQEQSTTINNNQQQQFKQESLPSPSSPLPSSPLVKEEIQQSSSNIISPFTNNDIDSKLKSRIENGIKCLNTLFNSLKNRPFVDGLSSKYCKIITTSLNIFQILFFLRNLETQSWTKIFSKTIEKIEQYQKNTNNKHIIKITDKSNSTQKNSKKINDQDNVIISKSTISHMIGMIKDYLFIGCGIYANVKVEYVDDYNNERYVQFYIYNYDQYESSPDQILVELEKMTSKVTCCYFSIVFDESLLPIYC